MEGWKLYLVLLAGVVLCCLADAGEQNPYSAPPVPVSAKSLVFPKCWPADTFIKVNDSYYEGESGFPEVEAHGRCQEVCRQGYEKTYYGVRRNGDVGARAQCYCEETLNVSSTGHICNFVCAGYPCGDDDSGSPVITVYPVCERGKHGPYCLDDCPGRCNNESVCHVKTGDCPDGCQDGYYQDDCSGKCGNCASGRCHQWGSKAAECQDGGCLTGFTGAKCDTECSPNCIGKSCDQDPPHCSIGCHDGWYGPTCETPCPENCNNARCDSISGDCLSGCYPEWWYGKKCEQLCHHNCTDLYCNTTFTDGICHSCNDGWYGEKCTVPCPQNCYSHACEFGSGICSSCKVGYHGDQCEEQCPQNCFEDICQKDGSCFIGCDPGWKGPACATDQNECEGEGDGHHCEALEKICHNIPGFYLCCDKDAAVSSETMTCEPKETINEDNGLPGYGIAVIVVLVLLCGGLVIALIVAISQRTSRSGDNNSQTSLVNPQENQEKHPSEKPRPDVSAEDINAAILDYGNSYQNQGYEGLQNGAAPGYPGNPDTTYQVINDNMVNGRDSPAGTVTTPHK